jgi:hypothetical protein
MKPREIDQFVQQLRNLLARYTAEDAPDGAADQSRENPRLRMSIGQALHSDGEMRLEITFFDRDGEAAAIAREARNSHPADVELRYVPQEISPLQTLRPRFSALRERQRPLHLGQSIGHIDGTCIGSIGGFARSSDGRLGVLSASHVLAISGDLKSSDVNVVHQPSPLDAERYAGEVTRIGNLKHHVALQLHRENPLDAAFALLDRSVTSAGNQIPRGLRFPDEGAQIQRVVRDPRAVERGTRIAKIGCMTGYTLGKLRSVNVNRRVYDPNKGEIELGNLIEVEWIDSCDFAALGDSGALYFIEETKEALAIHIASEEDERLSWGCGLSSILGLWNLTWLDSPPRQWRPRGPSLREPDEPGDSNLTALRRTDGKSGSSTDLLTDDPGKAYITSDIIADLVAILKSGLPHRARECMLLYRYSLDAYGSRLPPSIVVRVIHYHAGLVHSEYPLKSLTNSWQRYTKHPVIQNGRIYEHPLWRKPSDKLFRILFDKEVFKILHQVELTEDVMKAAEETHLAASRRRNPIGTHQFGIPVSASDKTIAVTAATWTGEDSQAASILSSTPSEASRGPRRKIDLIDPEKHPVPPLPYDNRFVFHRPLMGSRKEIEIFVGLSDSDPSISESHEDIGLYGDSRRTLYKQWQQWQCIGSSHFFYLTFRDELSQDTRLIAATIILPITTRGTSRIEQRKTDAVGLEEEDIYKGDGHLSGILFDTLIVKPEKESEEVFGKPLREPHDGYAYYMLLRHLAQFWSFEIPAKFFIEPDYIQMDRWCRRNNLRETLDHKCFIFDYAPEMDLNQLSPDLKKMVWLFDQVKNWPVIEGPGDLVL